IPTYPAWWVPTNCAHTHAGLARSGLPVPPESATAPRYFNSGLLLLRPSAEAFAELLNDLATKAEKLAEYRFPDQDYLNALHPDFEPLPYVYNALKTLWKYHKDLWRTEEVANVHYILEKPWDVPGGEYEPINGWWWNVWEGKELFAERKAFANGIPNGIPNGKA
ncbi:hypothetical protein HDU96_010941, partial [Phlyctochytrium bullatum]